MARATSLGLAVVLATIVAVTLAVVVSIPAEVGALIMTGVAMVLGQSP